MDAEIVRDIALAASGLAASQRSAGQCVSPGAGVSVHAARQLRAQGLDESTGPDRYRRALYTFRYRSVPYPMLETFDAPNGDSYLRPAGPLEHAAAGADYA